MKKAKIKLKENVFLKLKDKNGIRKKLFQQNRLFKNLMKWGIVSPMFPKIPLLLGKWSDSICNSNLITNAGMAGIASRINGSGSESAFTYIAVGTGTTAAAVTDTTLETEVTDSGLERASATASRTTTDVANDTATLVHEFTVTGTVAVTEVGILNAASDGVLLNHQVIAAVNVADGDTLEVTMSFDVD